MVAPESRGTPQTIMQLIDLGGGGSVGSPYLYDLSLTLSETGPTASRRSMGVIPGHPDSVVSSLWFSNLTNDINVYGYAADRTGHIAYKSLSSMNDIGGSTINQVVARLPDNRAVIVFNVNGSALRFSELEAYPSGAVVERDTDYGIVPAVSSGTSEKIFFASLSETEFVAIYDRTADNHYQAVSLVWDADDPTRFYGALNSVSNLLVTGGGLWYGTYPDLMRLPGTNKFVIGGRTSSGDLSFAIISYTGTTGSLGTLTVAGTGYTWNSDLSVFLVPMTEDRFFFVGSEDNENMFFLHVQLDGSGAIASTNKTVLPSPLDMGPLVIEPGDKSSHITRGVWLPEQSVLFTTISNQANYVSTYPGTPYTYHAIFLVDDLGTVSYASIPQRYDPLGSGDSFDRTEMVNFQTILDSPSRSVVVFGQPTSTGASRLVSAVIEPVSQAPEDEDWGSGYDPETKYDIKSDNSGTYNYSDTIVWNSGSITANVIVFRADEQYEFAPVTDSKWITFQRQERGLFTSMNTYTRSSQSGGVALQRVAPMEIGSSVLLFYATYTSAPRFRAMTLNPTSAALVTSSNVTSPPSMPNVDISFGWHAKLYRLSDSTFFLHYLKEDGGVAVSTWTVAPLPVITTTATTRNQIEESFAGSADSAISCRLTGTDKFVTVYRNSAATDPALLFRVISVSGTAITVGPEYEATVTNPAAHPSVLTVSANEFIIMSASDSDDLEFVHVTLDGSDAPSAQVVSTIATSTSSATPGELTRYEGIWIPSRSRLFVCYGDDAVQVHFLTCGLEEGVVSEIEDMLFLPVLDRYQIDPFGPMAMEIVDDTSESTTVTFGIHGINYDIPDDPFEQAFIVHVRFDEPLAVAP